MKKYKIIKYTYLLFIILSIFSVELGNKLQINNTYLQWILYLLIVRVYTIYYNNTKTNNLTLKFTNIFLIYTFIRSIQGIYEIENYWTAKRFIEGTFMLILPLSIYYFQEPENIVKSFNKWTTYILIIFFGIFIFTLKTSYYHFLLSPLLFFGIFATINNNKTNFKIFIIIIIIILMTFIDLGARSQVIKSIMTLIIIILTTIKDKYSTQIIKKLYYPLIITPIITIITGISGIYNPFIELPKLLEGKTFTYNNESEIIEENLDADTRTFIYVEVIESAIKNNYIFFGRTQTHGNDSEFFQQNNTEEKNNKNDERYINEVGFLNIFTWLGITGLIIYICIFISASYYAIFKSQNRYSKFIGLFILFHYIYGWIEDSNKFDINNTTIFVALALGSSNKIRNMNNGQFKQWQKQII